MAFPSARDVLRGGWAAHEGYIEITGRDCVISVEPRPHYCDRGNYIAKLSSTTGALALDIDRADGWPRYYFDLTVAQQECEAWLVKRKQWVERG